MCDILYKKKPVQNIEADVDFEIEVEEDANDDFDDTEIEVDLQIETPELNEDLENIIKKVRKTVKYFRQSPVRNDEYLQPLVCQSFGKELILYIGKSNFNFIISPLDGAS